jgi:hypothetical protein
MKIIRKVWVNRTSGQKLVTIPKTVDIKGGDWVQIEDMEKKDGTEQRD